MKVCFTKKSEEEEEEEMMMMMMMMMNLSTGKRSLRVTR